MKNLGEVADFRYGFTDKAQDKGNVRFIRITDIGDDGCLLPNNAKYLNISKENEGYVLHQGDVLVARTGATYGKTLIIRDKDPAVYASFLIKIELDNSKILNKFYWHFAQSQLYWIQANALVSKAGQPQFNANALTRVVVPIPPLAEQARIVAILDRFDTLTSDISEGLPAEIEARRKQYEYYRDKLLTFKENKK
jgi:type I restriction enzyme S subunit